MDLLNKIENAKPQYLFFLLFLIFLVFYAIQVPTYIANADVLAYTCRATSNAPINSFVYLDQYTHRLLGDETYPNYHIGHTLLLRLIYMLVPHAYAKTILPAGFLSALCGALIVGFTFLIWLSLGFNKKASFFIAICSGLIPTLCYNNIIGEAYSPQLLFIVLSLYFFFRNRVFFTVLFFCSALLISPLSALCFPLLFIKSRDKRTLFLPFIILLASFLTYVVACFALKVDIIKAFRIISTIPGGSSLIFRIYKYIELLVLNINFLFLFMLIGIWIIWKNHKRLFIVLLLGSIPYLVLGLLSRDFIVDYGNNLFVLFWILSVPIGFSLSQNKRLWYTSALSLIFLFAVFQVGWALPNNRIGRSLEDAGKRTRMVVPEEIPIVGPWKSALAITLGKYGWNYEKIASLYIEYQGPDEQILLNANIDTLLVVSEKMPTPKWKNNLKKKLPGSWFLKEPKNFINEKFAGTVNLIYENDLVYVYKWTRKNNT